MRVAIVIISVVARTKEKVEERTYVAPMREHINCIITPDDWINEKIQKTKRSPDHVKASAKIPSMNVPC